MSRGRGPARRDGQPTASAPATDSGLAQALTTRRSALGITAAATAGFLAERALAPEIARAETLQNLSVRAVATANIASLSGVPAKSSTDEVEVPAGQLVLLTGQSTGSQNGVWQVEAGAWVRPASFAHGSEQYGVLVPVLEGELRAGSIWLMKNKAKVTVDTTAQEWEENPGGIGLVLGSNVTALGRYAGGHLNANLESTALGTEAMFNNTFSPFNTAVGYRALYAAKPKAFTFKGTVKTGSNEITGIPAGAEREQFGKTVAEAEKYNGAYLEGVGILSTGAGRTAITSMARLLSEGIIVMSNTASAEHTSETIEAHWGGGFNTALGWFALFNATTGAGNTAIGTNALSGITTGEESVAIGCEAQVSAKTASYNTSVGFRTLNANTTGFENVAIGYQSMAHHESGNENVAIGGFSMANGKSGTANVAIGYEALEQCSGSFNVSVGGAESVTTGEKNAVLGNEALALNETGSGNVAIGYHAGKQETGSNKLYIANSETTEPLIKGVFPNEELTFNTTKIALYKGVTPVAQHATIAAPGEKTKELSKAVKEIIEAIKAIGVIA